MKIGTIFCLISMILSTTCYQSVLAATSSPTAKFISLSDIHFNPFSVCTASASQCDTVNKLRAADYKEWDSIFIADGEEQKSKVGQDTNYPLLASTLETVQEINEEHHPKFVVVLGDFLAHHFKAQYVAYTHDTSDAGYQAFVHKTMQFLAYKLQETLPHTNVYAAVGNNDSYSGDYSVIPQGAFFKDTGDAWVNLIHDTANKDRLQKSFAQGGYYSVMLPNQNARLVMLNTVMFSKRATGENLPNAAQQQLTWLDQELQDATHKHQKVILAFHVPPGIDVHNTVTSLFKRVSEYWNPTYQAAFMSELQHYSTTIAAVLPGHTHMDTFQLFNTAQQKSLPVTFTPAVSPIFGNNPGFKLYSYDSKEMNLKGYDTYYLSLNNDTTGWKKEYSFNNVYQPNCKNCGLVNGMNQVMPTNELAQNFKQYYAVGNNAQPITKNNDWVPYYWCNLREIDAQGYSHCLKTKI